MLEIEEVIPYYLEIDEEGGHIQNPLYAKNQESVIIFEKFFETFHVVIDEYGRLVCTERKVE